MMVHELQISHNDRFGYARCDVDGFHLPALGRGLLDHRLQLSAVQTDPRLGLSVGL
jgi:hypothetical protein